MKIRKTIKTSAENQVECLTSDLKYFDDKIFRTFALFITLVTGITSGTVYLSYHPPAGLNHLNHLGFFINWVAAGVGVASTLVVTNNLRAWKRLRKRLSRYNRVGPPSRWWGINELIGCFGISVFVGGFVYFNPLEKWSFTGSFALFVACFIFGTSPIWPRQFRSKIKRNLGCVVHCPKRRSVLFILGLLIGFLGFAVANEMEIPIFTDMIYGKVRRLRAGFNEVCGLPTGVISVSERYRHLKTGDLELIPEDEGFAELSAFILDDLMRHESHYFAKTQSGSLSFNEFKKHALKNGFSKLIYKGVPGKAHDMNVPFGNNRLTAFLNKAPDESASFFIDLMERGIEMEYRSTTFAWASLTYFLGIFIQIFQFDWKSTNGTAPRGKSRRV